MTGEVRLKIFAEGAAALKRFAAFNDATLTLKALRDDNKGGAIARFAQVTDRNAAEAMRGLELTVPRSALPELGEGEYYHADLIGLPVVSADDGEAIGRIVAVENFGAGDILEIERDDAKRFMVPLNAEAVPHWDGERLVLNPAYAD